MKKLIVLALLAMSFSFVGCNSDKKEEVKAPETTQVTEEMAAPATVEAEQAATVEEVAVPTEGESAAVMPETNAPATEVAPAAEEEEDDEE